MTSDNRENLLCGEVERNIDALVRDQLSGDLGGLRLHLAACTECTEKVENRKEMKQRLRAANLSVEPPPYLGARIRAAIGDQQQASGRSLFGKYRWWMIATAACLGLILTLQVSDLRARVIWQEAYIDTVSSRVSSLLRVGLRDHIHCAVFRKFPKDAPDTATLMGKIGTEYAGLVPLVRKHVPERYRLMLAHQCTHRDRKFVHLTLTGDSRLLSLVVVRKRDGETFDKQGLIPVLAQSNIPMYRDKAVSYEISSFETRGHLVYFISDLPQDVNSRLMLAMAPEVKDLLDKPAI